MIREKNDEAALAAESKLLKEERQKTYDLQKQVSQIQLELNVAKEQRQSEVSALESRLKTETAAAKELEGKLRNDVRVSVDRYQITSTVLTTSRILSP